MSKSNKINTVNSLNTCCVSNCINSDLFYGECISGNGYVNVSGDGGMTYYGAEEYGW